MLRLATRLAWAAMTSEPDFEEMPFGMQIDVAQILKGFMAMLCCLGCISGPRL